jgi:hypothetical protein
VEYRFCDETEFGFSWIVDEPATRTSHALAHEERFWLIDPVDWPEAIERSRGLGEPAGVLQLLDRHNRDCAVLARRLGVLHLVVPETIPHSPFQVVTLKLARHWREVALWWPERATLVVAEALGTNDFFTAGRHPVGVHLLLRLRPPRDALAGLTPEHLLVGHGEGLHGLGTTASLVGALERSRRDLPAAVLRLPGLAVDARRRRR